MAASNTQNEPSSFARFSGFAARTLRVLELGRVTRGGQTAGEYQLGDLMRGLWANLRGRGQRPVLPRDEVACQLEEGNGRSSFVISDIVALGREGRGGEE